MDIETAFDDELARRLPLPLAQLYRRAHNAKGPRDRHDTAYCLWEAALKLLGATAVVAYAEHGAPAPELAERLRNLARPALGHWWEFVRLLVPVLADAGDAGFAAARELVLGRARDDLPRAAGLDAALREALDAAPGARVTVRLAELFDRLVRYRNREIGHGAAGQRPAEFYDRMGRALRLGVPELLGRLDVLAGRRLVAVTDIRPQTSGAWLVERHELVGEMPRRLGSQELPESEATRLPKLGRLYLVGPGPAAEEVPAWSLHPLVLYDHESAEVFFLNARRGRTRTEYLCYYPGRTVERPDLGGERRELLAHVLGGPVDDEQVEQWAARSQAEDPPGPPELAEPPRRLGEFELLSELGRGGMGVVYRAWQPSLGRQVALKSLLRAGDPKAEARFNREIHALGRVEHPHLVKVYTSGSEADRWYYAMELIEGATLGAVCGRLQGRGSSATELDVEAWRETLSTACQEARAAERPLSSDEPSADRPGRPRPEAHPPAGAAGRDYVRHVVELVRQVAEAAHALHEAGVIHRDIKPDNVLVTPDGSQAVLMDLGLAQLADEAEGRLTRTRQFVGTLRYASPEQVLSVPLDRRSDVYSLGATLWELLTLRPLFGATEQMPTPDLMLKVQSADPESPRRLNPRVPEDLEAIVLKCLEKDRGRRYGTAQELAEDLGRWLRGEPVQARPPTLGYLLGKSLRRHRVAVALISAVVLALVLGGVAAVSVRVAYRLNQLRQTAEEARDRADRARQGEALARATAERARSFAVAERDRANAERDGADRARRGEAEARRKAEQVSKSLRKTSGDLRMAREELRLRLVQKVDLANGVNLMDQGDLSGSLAWFADAYRLEQGDPGREDLLRIRLNAVLQHVPRLNHVLFHDGSVYHAAFSPDGRRVLTASRESGKAGEARLWDAATGQPATPAMKHQGPVYLATFSPDSRRVLTASGESGKAGEARLWDAATGQPATPAMKHQGPVYLATFSPDGRRVLTASGDEARVWDAATGQPLAPPMRHESPVLDAAFSPDGRRVLTASSDWTARLWDAATGQPVASPMRHEGAVNGAAFSPDGRRVLTASSDWTARLWDAATGQDVAPPMKHEGWVGHAVFSPDGRRVLTASGDHTARLWDAATGQPLAPHIKHEGEVNSAVFSPDGRCVLTASRDHTARVWDAATGQPLAPPMKHGGWVNSAAFSPDGRRVLTASGDHTARLWDAATGQPLAPPMRHEAAVNRAAFSPDGRRVLTASNDRTARLWDAATGQPVAPREDQVKDLIALAHMLSGLQVDRSGDLVPLTRDVFRAAWQDLRERYPDAFVCSPEEILSWHGREAAACEDVEVWSWAVIHLDALVAAEPESWMLFARRGHANAGLGRWPEAFADADRAIALRPEHDELWRLQGLWRLRAIASAELGRWEQAAADFTRTIDEDARDHIPQVRLARLRLARGDIEGYRRACARLLHDFGQGDNPHPSDQVTWTCVLTPGAVEDPEAVVRCARVAVEANSEDSAKHALLQTLGAATYRAGRFEEVIRHLNEAMKALPEPGPKPDGGPSGGVSPGPTRGGDALDWLFLAMAHHRLGHAVEARHWLDKAVAAIDRATQDPPDGASPDSRIDWQTRLYYRVLRREAEDLIGGSGGADLPADVFARP
jgi:WD40 repeat protein/serine/threonine protein kinase/tetratricopeptide (TPR) repeat protein